MENTKIIELTDHFGNVETHIVIDNGDGSFTSMLKSIYDELEAKKANELEAE